MISVRAYNNIKGKKELAVRIRLVFTWRQDPRASKKKEKREKKQNSIRNTKPISVGKKGGKKRSHRSSLKEKKGEN
jgi:hypothetical protein